MATTIAKIDHGAALREVLQAGIDAGYWTLLKPGYTEFWCTVSRPDPAAAGDGAHLTFDLHAHDGKVTADVANRGESGALLVTPGDVKVDSTDTTPSASASIDRGPVRVAKALYSRLVNEPTAMGFARRVRDRFAERQAQRADLLRIVALLTAQGFRLMGGHREVGAGEYWAVTMYGPGSIQMRVNADGTLYIDRLSSHVDHLPAILKACTR